MNYLNKFICGVATGGLVLISSNVFAAVYYSTYDYSNTCANYPYYCTSYSSYPTYPYAYYYVSPYDNTYYTNYYYPYNSSSYNPYYDGFVGSNYPYYYNDSYVVTDY